MSGCRARLAFGGGPDARGALRGDRPRAVVVGGSAAAGRADEARSRAPPLPRQVRPAARRGLPRPVLLAGRLRLRPLRRVRDDARRGERLRGVAIGCDISAFNCLLTRVKTRPYSLGALELRLRGTLEDCAARTEDAVDDGASAWLRAGTRRRRCASYSPTVRSTRRSTDPRGTSRASSSRAPPGRRA